MWRDQVMPAGRPRRRSSMRRRSPSGLGRSRSGLGRLPLGLRRRMLALASLPGRVARDRVHLALGGILAAGLALRVWFTLVWSPALTGYSDTGIYFTGALRSLWSDPIRTVGYSMFLRVLHAIWPHLILVVIVQHGLGLLAAVLVFATVSRCGGPRWLGLAPAAMVALGGDELFMEHAALSDSLFIFLLIAGLYCALRASPRPARWGAAQATRGSARWAALAGLCVGLDVWDRGAGVVMAAIIPLWLLFGAGRPTRRTLAVGALALAVSIATVGAYVGWRKAASDMPGLLTSNNAYNFYARAAPWADCSRFTPPPGTRALCDPTPPSRRVPAGEYYIYSPLSPAYKLFGPAYLVSKNPRAMAMLTEWTEAAILGEPLEYLHAVWLDTVRLFEPNARSYGDNSADELIRYMLYSYFHTGKNEFVEYWQERLYPHDPPPHHGDIGPLKRWEVLTRIDGAWMGLLLTLCLAGPWLLRRRARSGVALFGATALAMLFFPILVKGYDYRFTIPAFAPLVAAGTLSAWGLGVRLRSLIARRGDAEQSRPIQASRAHAPAGSEPLAPSRERLLGR
jgi:hypothetical protein